MRQWKMKLTAVLLALCCLVVVLPVHAQAAMVYTTVEEAVELIKSAAN